MRLHTDKIDVIDLWDAGRAASTPEDGVVYLRWTEHGSRKRTRAFEVGLEGDGTKNKRRRNSGRYGADKSGYAATWDAWGRFFAYLFDIDPDMTCYAYDGRDDFHAKTKGRFI